MYNSGLVLEGGGTRAIFSAGVTDAFIENEITFPYVIGVSAGTCVGASYLGKCKGRYRDLTVNYVNDKRYMGVGNLLKTGEFLGSDWIFGELSYDIYPLNQDEFEGANAVFGVVVVNAKTGRAEYIYPKTLRPRGCPEIRASCSMPIVTKGVEIGGELYYDGGLVDSIPLARALDDGCQRVVTVLTQHRGYQKQPVKSFMVKAIKKYPMIRADVENRHNMYNEQLKYVDEMKNAGLTYVIQPPEPLNCSTLEKNTAKLEHIYQLGYNEGLKNIEGVKSFLAKQEEL